jgi:hypothetical protein
MLVMRRYVSLAIFGAVVASAILSAQSAKPATQIRTFHARGTIRDSTGAAVRDAKVHVTFENEKLSVTVPTDEVGNYEVDLPLGVYAMSALGSRASLFRPYRRPEFRVISSINITLNVTLFRLPSAREGYCCRNSAVNASNVTYYDGDFFSIPSEDGVPFRLYVSYVKRVRSDNYYYDYTGDDEPPYEDSVFVAYNLFSLHADSVHYDMENRKLAAIGNVVVEDESGQHRAYSMTFRFENGQAILVQSSSTIPSDQH